MENDSNLAEQLYTEGRLRFHKQRRHIAKFLRAWESVVDARQKIITRKLENDLPLKNLPTVGQVYRTLIDREP